MKLPRDAFDIRSIRNLLLASLTTWFFTCILYSILSWLIEPLRTHSSMMAFCAIVVMILSLLFILLLSNYQLSSSLKSFGNLISYAFLIYLSTNGIQSVYSSIQSPSENTATVQAELIPFLDSRPWLPPAGMQKVIIKNTNNITQLTTDNYQLKNSLDSAVARLESCGLMTDSIFLTAIPTSREIGKGGMFRSEVVLAARLDKSYVKNVSVNESEIELKSGVGVFEENTGSLSLKSRNLNYKAVIELYGKEQEITTSDSYKIIQPFIEVSSQAVNSLFLNCGNQLNIQVPILGSDYRPKFMIDGASFKYGNQPGKITVLPTSRQVEIDVHNAGAYIGKKSFPVRRIPAPRVMPFANGKPMDLATGIPKSTSSVSLSVHPDAEFQRLLPNDANYRVQDCEITLISKGQLRGRMKGKANSNVSSLTKRAASGDQLKIEIKTVLRKNFKGDIEKVVNFYPKFFLVTIK